MLNKELKDRMLDRINAQDYEAARESLKEYWNKGFEMDELAAILAGSIYHYFNNRREEWNAICQGLTDNCENAELYVMLGNYYLEENRMQAAICYENALHYAQEEQDKKSIKRLLDGMDREYGVKPPKTAIIILSYHLLEDTKKCIESIRRTVPAFARQIIVVDNASGGQSVKWLRAQKDILLRENKVNEGFPKGCNQGIRMAEEDADIFLLNNDTILPPNALFWLKMGLYQQERTGTAGSVSNYVANLQQAAGDFSTVDKIMEFAVKNNVPMQYPYEEKLFLIGFALLIKRSVLNEVGLLDEIFSPGNSEDVDYGLRVMEAGYRNILCKNSFILHLGSRSFGKMGGGFADLLRKNQEKLNHKWNMDLQYYMFPRLELTGMIKENREKSMHVLDIGCGMGAIMAKIKGDYPNAKTYGIELQSRAAKLAANIGEVVCADVEQLDFPYPDAFFDYCIMGDVLEHLREPQNVLMRLRRHMKKDGKIIVSMPNMKHYSVILPLLKFDRFPYADSGILDRTHLKMYTNHEIQSLIMRSGYKIRSMCYTMVGKPDEKDERLIDLLTSCMEEPDKNTFLAYQYIVTADVAVDASPCGDAAADKNRNIK